MSRSPTHSASLPRPLRFPGHADGTALADDAVHADGPPRVDGFVRRRESPRVPRGRRLGFLWLVATFVLTLAVGARGAASRAGEPTFDEVYKTARARYVEKLDGLSTWAAENDLFAERDRVYRAILVLEPDNAFARKGLRYTRKSDGTWQDPAPREVKNMNAKLLPEVPAKRQAAVETYRTEMLTAFTTFQVDATVREKVFAELLLGDPEDATVRTSMGEVRMGDAWVLGETAMGRDRRMAIKDEVAKARAAVGDVWKVEPTEDEKALGVAFTTKLGTRHLRVLGTAPAEECTAIAQACEIGPALVKIALGADVALEPDFAVYVLTSIKDNGPLVDKLPRLDPTFRETLRKCVGAKIPGQPRVVTWDDKGPKRIDNASRSSLNDLFGRAFGIGLQHGWAWEGMGLYLNREIVGTRLTWFTQPGATSKADALRKKLMTTDVNWMNEALTLMQSPQHPPLATVLERDVNTLTTEEMVLAYAFSAYLIEGRPNETPEILRRVGVAKEKASTVVPAVLKLDLPQLEARFTRWLGERR